MFHENCTRCSAHNRRRFPGLVREPVSSVYRGGIVDMVTGLNAHPTDGALIGIGALKTFVLWETVGGLIFLVIGGLGALVLGWERPSFRRLKTSRLRRSARGVKR